METGKIGVREKKYLVYALLALILIPNAFAYFNSGISILDKPMTTFFGLFNIQALRTNPMIQDGFVIFVIFMSVFAAANTGLKKVFKDDHRAAGIISFAVAASGAFLMPMQWLRATGGLLSTLVYILIFGGLSYLAVTGLSKDKDGKPSWPKNVVGLVLVMFLLMANESFSMSVGLNPEQSLMQGTVVTWMTALLGALIIVKIVQMMKSFGSEVPAPAVPPPGGPVPPAGPAPPGGPAVPVTPPNIRDGLNRLARLVTQLNTTSPRVIAEGNAILQTINTRGRGAVNAADQNLFNDDLTNLANVIRNTHAEIEGIVTDHDFASITAADQLQFAHLSTAFLHTELNLFRYINEFAHRSAHGGGPFTP
ncbi:MAG: hypothetical protein V1866_04280 [archaeon]